MQTTSELYKELLANGARKEVRVEIAGEIYGEDRLCSLFTTGSLFSVDTLCAGSAVARQIDLVLRNYGNIPRMAKIIPSYRLVSGNQTSEWIQKGVFYIDTRVPDKTSGTLTIHGFDDMLKGSVIWEPDHTLVFPMTFRAAAQAIADEIGVELDNPEAIDDTYVIADYPANDYTMRNILQFVAAAHAANFVMTDLGKLRMVGINDIPVETSYLVTENGDAIVFGGIRLKLSDTASTTAGIGKKVFVGGKVASTGAPPSFDPISQIIVKVDDESAYFSGDDTGLTLEITCPYGNQTMADNILAKVKGFVYRPFTAEDALVDQAVELGDGITVDGVYTILAQQEITFDGLMSGRIAAPGQQEVESEYPYQTKEQQVDLKIARTNSRITKTAEDIRLEILGEDGPISALQLAVDGVTVTTVDEETGEKTITLKNGIVTSDAIDTGAITADKIAAGAITAEKIAADSITASALQGDTINIMKANSNKVSATMSPGYSNGNGLDLRTRLGPLFLHSPEEIVLNTQGDIVVSCGDDNYQGDFYPSGHSPNLGYARGLWKAVWAESGTIQTSDRNRKHDIEPLPEKYLSMMDMVVSKRFRLNSGTSNRYHVGFIAQDIEDAMSANGIESSEFGGWVKDVDADGNDMYLLRYEEFIAILWAKIRQQEDRLKKLEAKA